MRIVAIVQARMGSTRLPGKVLMDLGGRTVLANVLTRLQRCRHLDQIMVATSTEQVDDNVAVECHKLGANVFRGSEEDVLDRYYRAALAAQADAIVRITSDCPLIDAGITDKTIRAFVEKQPDYASNVLRRTYPRGLDTEVVRFGALQRAWEVASERYERAHVTPFLYGHPEQFSLLSVEGSEDYSHHRWTLDTVEDLEFLRMVHARCANAMDSGWHNLVTLIEHEPDLANINRDVVQKALHEE